MSPGDPILWTDSATGDRRPGKYVGTFGGRLIIETVTHTGHLGLRYVDPADVRPASTSTAPLPEHP